VHRLSAGSAERQEAGSAIGRAALGRELAPNDDSHNRALLNAAHEYERVQRNYRHAILARQLPSAGDLDRTHGYDGDDGLHPAYVEWCQKAERRMAESRRALLEAGPLVLFAVDTWVMEDKAVYELLGDLRLGLNALARLYGVDNGS
jgi:hypothetical protein